MSGTSSALVGYARAAGGADGLSARVRALTEAGCGRIYVDGEAGQRSSGRPEVAACLEALRAGDTLVVASLDQLGRSQRKLFALVDDVRGTAPGSARCASGWTPPRPVGRRSSACLPGYGLRAGDDLGRDQRRARRRRGQPVSDLAGLRR